MGSGPRERLDSTGDAFEWELDLFLLFVLELDHASLDIRGRRSVGFTHHSQVRLASASFNRPACWICSL